jgi:hypothetical protein
MFKAAPSPVAIGCDPSKAPLMCWLTRVAPVTCCPSNCAPVPIRHPSLTCPAQHCPFLANPCPTNQHAPVTTQHAPVTCCSECHTGAARARCRRDLCTCTAVLTLRNKHLRQQRKSVGCRGRSLERPAGICKARRCRQDRTCAKQLQEHHTTVVAGEDHVQCGCDDPDGHESRPQREHSGALRTQTRHHNVLLVSPNSTIEAHLSQCCQRASNHRNPGCSTKRIRRLNGQP